ncbi:hypothetical protein HMPREF1545_04118 [Oscillibacter sp. KLE 1728]|nr:hypothetical protein HMPREF1545_04118 [Oscillibacter sp. KLE 1728]ERK59065.1 hypothetical protein HMPREF1546_03534 [Oscillibacter sp. KLE 1745]
MTGRSIPHTPAKREGGWCEPLRGGGRTGTLEPRGGNALPVPAVTG